TDKIKCRSYKSSHLTPPLHSLMSFAEQNRQLRRDSPFPCPSPIREREPGSDIVKHYRICLSKITRGLFLNEPAVVLHDETRCVHLQCGGKSATRTFVFIGSDVDVAVYLVKWL